MDPNALHDQLEKLHAELKDAPQVDPRSNQLMVEVLQDIRRLLEQKRAADAPLPGADASLPGRLEQVAVQFEADHPTLAASSRRLIDLLGKAGL
jgi:predicted component of type VI protein secretion system